MIIQVASNLLIADMEGCKRVDNSAIIHACKEPCFRGVVATVDKLHPNYLFFETANDLYLNIIDPEQPLFYKETFEVALNFIKKNIDKRKLVIHCNEGISRSPTLALLYLYKDKCNSFLEAEDLFVEKYPYYEPSFGISQYMKMNWNLF